MPRLLGGAGGGSGFSTPGVFTITDANNATVTNALSLKHLLSAGAALAGMGVGMIWSLPNAAGTEGVRGQISNEWTNPAAGSETSQFTFNLQNAGAVLGAAARLHGSGLLQLGSVVGVATAAGVRIHLPNNTSISWRNAANTANIVGIVLDSSDNLSLGASGTTTLNQGQLTVLDTLRVQNAAIVSNFFDGASAAITDLVFLQHTVASGASGIGTGLVFQASNSVNTIVSAARFAGILTTATAGSELGAAEIYALTGGSFARIARFWSNGAIDLSGGTAALGANSLRIPYNAGNAMLIRIGASDYLVYGHDGTTASFGDASFATNFNGIAGSLRSGGSLDLFGLGNVTVYTTSVLTAVFAAAGTSLQLGRGDGSATTSPFSIVGAARTGADAAASLLIVRGFLGTGTGAVGSLRFEGGSLTGSGTGPHPTVTLMSLAYSATDNDTSMELRVRKAGVETVERVTLVAGASVAASGRNFLSVS